MGKAVALRKKDDDLMVVDKVSSVSKTLAHSYCITHGGEEESVCDDVFSELLRDEREGFDDYLEVYSC
jgi:hypothetical protein